MMFGGVPQDVYDRHTQVLINAQGSLIQQNEWLRDQYELLLEKYHALKVSGASVPEPTPILQRPEFDAVQAAITAKAGPDKRLRAMMSREAMQSRAAGIPDIEIIQAIEQGVTVDEEGVV